MHSPKDSFETILADFKNDLSPIQRHDFQFVTLDDVRKTALRIQRDQEQLKSLMHLSRLESFIEAMTQFGKVVEVFANSSIFVAFVWGPMKFILLTASTRNEIFELILDAYSQIGEHMPLLEQYKSLFGTKPAMQRVLALIYTDILNFHKNAVGIFRKKADVWRYLFRSIWKDYETKFKGILNSLMLHKQLIAEQANLLQFEELHSSIQNSSQELFAHINQYEQDRSARWTRLSREDEDEKKKKRSAVLTWFSAARSTISDHESFCRTRIPETGSGEWILKHEKVQGWIEMDPPVSSILWLNGIPGAGKTILASVIVQSLLNSTSTVSYFYCREDDPEKNDCISIFRGLLSQLLYHCQEIVPLCYEKSLVSGQLNLSSLGLAEKLLMLSFETIPKPFIIIDGLDECNTAQRKLVLTFFTNIVERLDEQEPGKLRVLFVSQDFPDIKKALEAATILDLTPKDNENDIKSYVNAWSKRIEEKYELNTEDIKFIQESTVVRSKGMFLFAKLVMENLHAQETQMDLLNEIRGYTFPKEIGDAYKRILCRLQRSMHPEQWKIVRKLLGWIVCAKRPLKWREIQAAVSIDTCRQMFDFHGRKLRSSVEEYCGSLIQVLSDDRIELVHATAKIYIGESEYIRKSVVECSLAALCLQYLTFECFDMELDANSVQNRTTEGFLSLQDYAAAQWQQHIRAIISPQISQFPTDPESQNILTELGMGLDDFSIRYEQELMYASTSKEVEEDCEPFRAYPFYTSLIKVWNHVNQQDRKGLEARKEISIKSLSEAVTRNRVVLEKLTLSEEIRTFYGENLFKCPRPTCFYFHEGFKEEKSRKQHINRHDRPFNCSFPDCSIAEFGFTSNKDLEKHMKLFHPEAGDLANSFSTQTKPTGATPFVCKLCGKRFTRNFHWRSHMRSHAGERPFKCSECDKAFTRSNDCRRHEKIHGRK